MFSVSPRLLNLKCILVKDALGPVHFTAGVFLMPVAYQNGISTYSGEDMGHFWGFDSVRGSNQELL